MDEIRKLVHALRSSHRAATNINVTGAQLFVISILAEANGAISVGELAERTRTDPSTVSVVVSRLVSRGLVKRARSDRDARRIELSLTSKGRALRQRAPQTVAQKRLADSLERLSDRDLAALCRTLETIVAEMGGRPSAHPALMFDDARPAPAKSGDSRRRRSRMNG